MKHFLNKISVIFVVATTMIISYQASANELRLSKLEALKQGFKPVKKSQGRTAPTSPFQPHSLPWPVQFFDNKHTIGNSMPEYQNYSDEAYYHEGFDLRVGAQGEVKAPADGLLQGGYYTYVTDPQTGEDQKFSKPITEGGDDLYFEITIRLTDGTQFEFHHINPNKLPKNIYDMVLAGGGQIAKGATIGYASIWPMSRIDSRYDHIHYNLISASGAYLNAEYFSEVIEDKKAPVIKNIFAIYADKKVEVLKQKLEKVPQELIVSTYDMKGTNIYPLPPVLIQASWNQSEKAGWDFTQFLLNPLGKFPDIRELYARNLRLDDGRRFSTEGNYSQTEFLFRLKLPATATLPITLTIKDVNGNSTETILN